MGAWVTRTPGALNGFVPLLEAQGSGSQVFKIDAIATRRRRLSISTFINAGVAEQGGHRN